MLLEAGFECILVDIDSAQLKSTVSELKTYGSACHEYSADISDVAQIEKLVEWVKNEGLGVTALINNAAYESQASAANITSAELEKSFRTNLNGPLYLASLFAKEWIAQSTQGGIVFTSSVHSQIIRTHPLYSASKAAIEMFVKEAALEFAEHGIRVNAVAPGPTQDTSELKADYRVPLGYYQQPKDIGEGVAFLLSDKARFITGQSLIIDGGYSLTHVHHWLKAGKLLP